MEGLAAFFVESTFLGLWIFGWGKLSPGVHLACDLGCGALGTALSAYFILAANSWMQHPVGYDDARRPAAELTNIFDVLTNNTAIYAFPHTILAALLTAGMVVHRASRPGTSGAAARARACSAARCGSALPMVAVAAFAAASSSAHFDGVLMSKQQPMKMAAAEALFETKDGARALALRDGRLQVRPRGPEPQRADPQPALVDLDRATADGEVEGINEINREYRAKYGPGEYVPDRRRHLLDVAG